MGWPFTGYDGLIEKVFIPHFNTHGESSIPYLVDGRISRMAFMSAYRSLPPIEEMPPKEKKEMKQYIISLFPDKTPEEKIIACKIVYTIGTLI